MISECSSKSEEQVDKLQPIPAYAMEGKTQHACEVINQNVLQLLLNNSTRILKDLPLTGEFVQIKWIVANFTNFVRISTVTLQPEADDEYYDSDNSWEKRQRQQKRLSNANKRSKSTIDKPEVEDGTQLQTLIQAIAVKEAKDSI